jgi:hypothetical protein
MNLECDHRLLLKYCKILALLYSTSVIYSERSFWDSSFLMPFVPLFGSLSKANWGDNLQPILSRDILFNEIVIYTGIIRIQISISVRFSFNPHPPDSILSLNVIQFLSEILILLSRICGSKVQNIVQLSVLFVPKLATNMAPLSCRHFRSRIWDRRCDLAARPSPWMCVDFIHFASFHPGNSVPFITLSSADGRVRITAILAHEPQNAPLHPL